MQILADRAYRRLSSMLPNHNKVWVPFDKPKGGNQFAVAHITESRKMSTLRYIIEAVNSRSASWRGADDVVTRANLPHLPNSVFLSYSMSIFMKCLHQPKGSIKYETIIDAVVTAFAKFEYIQFSN